MVAALDEETACLVRVAAVLAGGSPDAVDAALGEAERLVRPEWVEEVILQTCLFAGFPRALNGMQAWRRLSGRAAPGRDAGEVPAGARPALGERTCGVVYGARYDRLRAHVQALHPALDRWMLEDGYGKVLSRQALDLARRELCIVAACAATGQEPQLRAHLRGALQAGVAEAVVDAAVDAALRAVEAGLPDGGSGQVRQCWERVRGG